jgi:acyl-CoA thioester hydrolase
MTQTTHIVSDEQPEDDLPVIFRMPLELRWRDLDAFNHVNNANFMTFLEEARIRWLESTGAQWISEEINPLLAAVQINYRLPIPYPASIFVELFAERIGNTSLTLGHRIVGEADRIYADGHVVMVWIDRRNGRPVALPSGVRSAAEMG